eukprot:COSAG01_NODE_17024_length_1184_cov_1.425806_1_plen_277_part_10
MASLLRRGVLSAANQPDVFFPHYSPPAECGAAGCVAWSEVAGSGKLWAEGQVPTNASNICAIPGAVVDKAIGGPETAAAGPFCYCRDTKSAHWCMPQMWIPEQINLQYASQDTVVAAFVTYEPVPPSAMAVAALREAADDTTAAASQLTGVSHWLSFTPLKSGCQKPGTAHGCNHQTSNYSLNDSQRNYTMHFVKLAGLKPATKYTYKVKSGSAHGVWSSEYTFRSARPSPQTAIAMYGDMAITRYNAVGNLLADCTSGRIDIFVHMGDVSDMHYCF